MDGSVACVGQMELSVWASRHAICDHLARPTCAPGTSRRSLNDDCMGIRGSLCHRGRCFLRFRSGAGGAPLRTSEGALSIELLWHVRLDGSTGVQKPPCAMS